MIRTVGCMSIGPLLPSFDFVSRKLCGIPWCCKGIPKKPHMQRRQICVHSLTKVAQCNQPAARMVTDYSRKSLHTGDSVLVSDASRLGTQQWQEPGLTWSRVPRAEPMHNSLPCHSGHLYVSLWAMTAVAGGGG
jgi:hypothetical protein